MDFLKKKQVFNLLDIRHIYIYKKKQTCKYKEDVVRSAMIWVVTTLPVNQSFHGLSTTSVLENRRGLGGTWKSPGCYTTRKLSIRMENTNHLRRCLLLKLVIFPMSMLVFRREKIIFVENNLYVSLATFFFSWFKETSLKDWKSCSQEETPL